MSLGSEVLDYEARPLRRDEIADGLNTDPERCPVDACGNCGPRCMCAPCVCQGCVRRGELAAEPAPAEGPTGQLVLL